MAEEEVVIEVDAVQAVYGDDCLVLQSYPPHIQIHIKPRTAEISSQQVPPAFSPLPSSITHTPLPSITCSVHTVLISKINTVESFLLFWVSCQFDALLGAVGFSTFKV